MTFAVSNGAQAATYYFHNDHLGTPQVLTDDEQNVVWEAEYDPFGKATETVTIVEQNLRFPGQYLDRETGLHYNYFRTYDPQIGRYIQSDPIGLTGGANTYAYVFNNPLNATDPSGLDCVAVNGRVTCTPPGGPTVQFPQPSGWPATMNNNSSNFHSYNIAVSLAGADAACVMQGIIDNPTPGSPNQASPQGTSNNATPALATSLFDALDLISSFGNDQGSYNNSPVSSYTMNNGSVVVNVTMPGHPLHPGYVARTINGSTVNNFGEGIGALQGKYSPVAGLINGVWNGQTQGIIDNCSCQ